MLNLNWLLRINKKLMLMFFYLNKLVKIMLAFVSLVFLM